MKVTSYEDLVKVLNSIGCPYPNNQGGFFFRGLPNESFDLIPPLYYPPVPKNPKTKEMQILDEFIAKTNFGIGLATDQRTWRNAFYSRHWGLKSRMLDWTIDLSVALYFMFQNAHLQDTAALFILPKKLINFIREIPNASYYDYDQTAILNPAFALEDVALTGSKNRFVQHGRFLIQNYDIAGECFYKRNDHTVIKIQIAQCDLKLIYQECCMGKGYDPDIPLLVKTETDPIYKLCQELNKL